MAAGKKLSAEYPRFGFQPGQIPDDMREPFTLLVRLLETMLKEVSSAVNFNSVKYVSQNGRPTPLGGELYVWKDADATSTNPTHYLVFNDGADVVTFASEEVVA